MHLLGLDVGATKTVIALVSTEGRILESCRVLSIDLFQSESTPADALAKSIQCFCKQIGTELSGLSGIGIGVPGAIDQSSETVVSCPNLTILDGVCLGPELTSQLGIPVIVENDVNLICLGEHKVGRGKGIDDVVCVYVGSGIGAGLILNGRLYAGVDGAAGELGHTVIEPEGRICTCGRRGCLEMYCSGKALALRAESILSGNIYEDSVLAGNRAVQWNDAELVITAGKAGHPAALEELRKAFHYLGLGIANLVSILNPGLVILGGGIIENWLEGIDIVRATVRTYARSVSRDRVTIDRPSLGEKAGLVGASVLVQDWPTRRRTRNQT